MMIYRAHNRHINLCSVLAALLALYCLLEILLLFSQDSHLVLNKVRQSDSLTAHVMDLDLDMAQEEEGSPDLEDFHTTLQPLLEMDILNLQEESEEINSNLSHNIPQEVHDSKKDPFMSHILSKYSVQFDAERLEKLNLIRYHKISQSKMKHGLIDALKKFTANSSFPIPEVEEPYPDVCNGSAPFLLAIVLSVSDHRLSRQIIRNTWGSVVRNKPWPHVGAMNAPLSLIFVIGHTNVTPPLNDLLLGEQRQYKDILFVNVTENYRKLTHKMLGALHWVNNCCPGTNFILKVDEDSFVNMPLLIDFLLHHQSNLSGSVIGNIYNASKVFRLGKWAVPFWTYPFYHYPPYCSGSSYILSGDVIPALLQATNSSFPIPIEDAYITGILGWIAGIHKIHLAALAVFHESERYRGHPEICHFFDTRLAVTDLSVEVFDRIWLAVQMDYCKAKEHDGLDPLGHWDWNKRLLQRHHKGNGQKKKVNKRMQS